MVALGNKLDDVSVLGQLVAYVVDNLPLPLENPWRRNLRLADLAFFSDGRGAVVTLDGDVWMISGLKGDLRDIIWKRFTSGLHEPLGLCVRNDELFVNDRGHRFAAAIGDTELN